MTRPAFTFIDLFAGIGGFHAALSAMGGKCVYAVEIDPAAAKVYEANWGTSSLGDITEDANDDKVRVPAHDVLVAGFPCQPFSKSGMQLGMEETRGTLYWNILRIIEERKPQIVLLENVRNLAGPRHRHEWEVIIRTLREQGYRVSSGPTILSPHWIPAEFGGRPQARERVFIAATLANDANADLIAEPVISKHTFSDWSHLDWNLKKDLPLDLRLRAKKLQLDESEIYWIDAWDDFVQRIRKATNKRLPGFPLWADSWVNPNYIDFELPHWKKEILRKNHEFYIEHKKIIDPWARKWNLYSDFFPASRRKLEWQAQDLTSLWECIMHFRPSGIRAKAPNYVPALVAITQTSIVGPLRRRLSVKEASRLQGLPDWFSFGNQNDSSSYRQLGNGVSVGAVWQVLKAQAERDKDLLLSNSPKLYKAIIEAPQNPDQALKSLGKHDE
jgi:DNA (cytosine-5)-methyltransferase 1